MNRIFVREEKERKKDLFNFCFGNEVEDEDGKRLFPYQEVLWYTLGKAQDVIEFWKMQIISKRMYFQSYHQSFAKNSETMYANQEIEDEVYNTNVVFLRMRFDKSVSSFRVKPEKKTIKLK